MVTTAPSPPRIVLVDDDAAIRETMSAFLTRHSFTVDTAANGAELERILARGEADLIILDVMMPGEDGLSIVKRLSDHPGPPIILFSAMGEDTDRIIGLELGAADYVPKPVNPRELLARVRAVLRGKQQRAVKGGNFTGYAFEGWVFDVLRRSLQAPSGTLVELSSGQFSLLRAFVENPERLVTRDELVTMSLGADSEAFDRAIDVQISRLRGKLDQEGDGRSMIRTIRSGGYMFTPRVTRF